MVAEDEMACESMPGLVVSAKGMDPQVWWLLVSLLIALVLTVMCCLGTFLYMLKLKWAVRDNDVLAQRAAADAVVEVTPLAEILIVQKTEDEIRNEIRVLMREHTAPVH